MDMSGIKRTLLSLLLLVCLALGVLNVSAADERLGEVVDGSVLTEELSAEGIAYPKLRGAYLSAGTGNISVVGGRKLTISGSTTAYSTVDEIKVSLYLQRLVGSSWVTLTKLGPVTNYNTYKVSTSATYSVDGGYYYRVSGGHTVIVGSTSEAGTSCTNGVWID
jgi:hypothetical protein